MKRAYILMVWLLAGVCSLAPAAAGDDGKGLEVGDTAPAFSLRGSDGKTYTLADLTAQRPVVIAWFPMAFTSG